MKTFIQRLIDRQTAIIDNETCDSGPSCGSKQKNSLNLQRQLRENDLYASEIWRLLKLKKLVNLEYAGFASSIGEYVKQFSWRK